MPAAAPSSRAESVTNTGAVIGVCLRGLAVLVLVLVLRCAGRGRGGCSGARAYGGADAYAGERTSPPPRARRPAARSDGPARG
ncbi:hypothetical protein GCM10010495_17780 [Kitasatospora herbaricolor]|nr:hypothetical protein GCM10010495_17780 [Kitasatospora herbaricolor]